MIPGIPVNSAVDGNGYAALQMGFKTGISFAQPFEQLADVFCFNKNGRRSTNNWSERPPEVDFNHRQLLSASIAFNTRGGDMGIWVMRTPVAFETALATAASGGTIEVSPTPRTP